VKLGAHRALFAAGLAVVTLLSGKVSAYVLSGVSWPDRPVPYSINTTNMDLPDAAVETAMQAGANVWSQQTNASVGFTYTGRSAQTTTGNDGLNLVVFRNAASGSAIATTYWWSQGSAIVDADVIFWDGAFQFFAGATGCVNGFYIEDIAAHEFGHVLGLGHSTVATATMYPSVSPCNMSNRTLDPDDIAGITALYPPMTLPTAPTRVRIIGPALH
jgi:hypothetical protein